MELALQIISNAKTARSDTVHDLKKFSNQPLTTQAEKWEQLVSLMPAFEKAFNLMFDVILELHPENEKLKDKIESYDGYGLKNLKQDCYNRSMTKKKQI